MAKFLRFLTIALLVWLPVRAAAEEPADGIQSVIASQLQAFQQNDVDTAFGFASPSIQ